MLEGGIYTQKRAILNQLCSRQRESHGWPSFLHEWKCEDKSRGEEAGFCGTCGDCAGSEHSWQHGRFFKRLHEFLKEKTHTREPHLHFKQKGTVIVKDTRGIAPQIESQSCKRHKRKIAPQIESQRGKHCRRVPQRLQRGRAHGVCVAAQSLSSNQG